MTSFQEVLNPVVVYNRMNYVNQYQNEFIFCQCACNLFIATFFDNNSQIDAFNHRVDCSSTLTLKTFPDFIFQGTAFCLS